MDRQPETGRSGNLRRVTGPTPSAPAAGQPTIDGTVADPDDADTLRPGSIQPVPGPLMADDPPVTDQPVTQPPAPQSPTAAQSPTTDTPATDTPMTDQSVTDQSVTTQSVTDQSVTAQSVTGPAMTEPAAGPPPVTEPPPAAGPPVSFIEPPPSITDRPETSAGPPHAFTGSPHAFTGPPHAFTGLPALIDQQPVVNDRRLRSIRAAAVDALVVGTSAVRVFARHWPALFVLALLGIAGQTWFLKAAVQASRLDAAAGLLVLLFVPIAWLTSIVLMLRAVRPSLSGLRGTEVYEAGGRPRSLWNHVGAVVVPFLAVYTTYGYLQSDIGQYFYAVFESSVFQEGDLFGNPEGTLDDFEKRAPTHVTPLTITVVGVSVVLRWLLGRWEGAKRRPWISVPSGYLEVVWITVATATFAMATNSAIAWAGHRRLIQWVDTTLAGLADRMGPFSGVAHTLLRYLGFMASSIDLVILMPVAWLAVGTVVYGYRIAAEPPPSDVLHRRAGERWPRIPVPVRWPIVEIGADLRRRFAPLIQGLRFLGGAGLRPMLVFCLMFVVVQTTSDWLWELERLIIGPQSLPAFWVGASGILSVLNETIELSLSMALLAAAVDRVLRLRRAAVATRLRRAAVATRAAAVPVQRGSSDQPLVSRA